MGLFAKHEWGDVQPVAGSRGFTREPRIVPNRMHPLVKLGHQGCRLSPTANTWVFAKDLRY